MSRIKKWKNPGTDRNSGYNGLYSSWCDMKRRVGNKVGNRPTYSDVTVCEEWYDYDIFFEWAIKNGWKPGLCIDKDILKPGNRIYCPEYCCWVTRSENSKECLKRNGVPLKNPEIAAKRSGDKHPMKNLETKLKVSGKNNRNAKKVKCIETGKIYECCADAELELNLSRSSVSNAANPKGHRKTTNGLHWEYV